MWKRWDAYRILIRKPEGKKPLRKLKHRQEDNIKMDLKEIGFESMDWIQLTQDVVQCELL
jgi:hypothetical protein